MVLSGRPGFGTSAPEAGGYSALSLQHLMQPLR